MTHIDLSNDEVSTLAFGLVRYALGRQTYAVGDAIALMRRLRPRMLEHEWGILRREILDAIDRDRAGSAADSADWARLAEELR